MDYASYAIMLKGYMKAGNLNEGIRWYKNAKKEGRVGVHFYTILFQLLVADLSPDSISDKVKLGGKDPYLEMEGDFDSEISEFSSSNSSIENEIAKESLPLRRRLILFWKKEMEARSIGWDGVSIGQYIRSLYHLDMLEEVVQVCFSFKTNSCFGKLNI